jgi:hypothetical protein
MSCDKNLLNSAVKFYCKHCDYGTSRKSSYDDHNLSTKHKILQNPTQNPTNNNAYVCHCGKSYKHSSSMYAHKKKCTIKVKQTIEYDTINNSNEPSDKELIIMVITQNTQLIKENIELKNMMLHETSNCKTMMIEHSNMMMEVIKNGINNNNTITNSHNKTFNLQFFLNETCKDAMNIMDFIESIKLQLSDLESVGKLGYVEGISNIITTNLNALDVTQRPVHCADKKRETMYIKDENKWEKEDESKKKIRKAIKRIVCKNQNMIPSFNEVHPDCLKSSSKFSDQYNKIIVESMGGSGDNDEEKEDKIIKNISKNVIIEK